MPRTTDAPEVSRRRPRREEVRRALLDAAARVFARHGVNGASLADVASEAGFTKGAVYSNFASKADLLEALVSDRTDAVVELGTTAAAEATGDLPDRARALGHALDRAAAEQADWHQLLIELAQLAMRGDPSAADFTRGRAELHAAIADQVAGYAQLEDARLPLSPAETATVLMALTNGMSIERMVAPGEVRDGLLGDVLALLTGLDQPTRR